MAITEEQKAIAAIATTEPVYNTGRGYGFACIYKCHPWVQGKVKHGPACPWVIFKSQPSVILIVEDFLREREDADLPGGAK